MSTLVNKPEPPAARPENIVKHAPFNSPTPKLDPNDDVSLEDLAKVDFSNKPEAVKKLDAEIAAAAGETQSAVPDPFKNLFILIYKANGPIEHVFFRSERVKPLIERDCKIWCQSRSYRYLSFKPALINLLDTSGKATDQGPAAGDITDLVTRQSRAENAKLASRNNS
jgi:hypothetical protein